jgi:hypothetical protein
LLFLRPSGLPLLPFWNGIVHVALAVRFAGVTPGFGLLKPVLELLEQHVVAGAINFGLDGAVDVNPRVALDPLDGGAFAVSDVTEHGVADDGHDPRASSSLGSTVKGSEGRHHP